MPHTRNLIKNWIRKMMTPRCDGLSVRNNPFLFLFLSLQYRVESMMLRIAKPMNYIAVSPSIEQRGL